MRGTFEVCGCFPTGRHYPGIADRLRRAVLAVTGLSRSFAPDTRWISANLAVIDFETTGLAPETDRIVEIGIACFNGGQLTKLKHWLVNPGMPIPEGARNVHGIGDAEVADAPRFEQLAVELVEVLKDHMPVAYNAAFDRAFLHAELERSGFNTRGDELAPACSAEVEWIDPLVWTRELYRDDSSRKLADIAARLGIALERAHRAASDAETTGRVLLALAERMPPSYSEVIGLQTQYAARQEVDLVRRPRR
ncbi:MAG TPA: 3'-5' exonuclease [Polyangiales bacterium]|nr:3'-5' exonuclease [Polyangiales bacterium]